MIVHPAALLLDNAKSTGYSMLNFLMKQSMQLSSETQKNFVEMKSFSLRATLLSILVFPTDVLDVRRISYTTRSTIFHTMKIANFASKIGINFQLKIKRNCKK